MNSENIIDAIQRGLDDLDVSMNEGSAAWTAAINTGLCRAGKELDLWVYAASCDAADGGEWLYDVTWLEYDGDFLTAAALVAECEWSGLSHINEDFQKLLLARSRVRLMIFDGHHQPKTQAIVELLARQVRYFGRSRFDDVWLFAAWETDDKSTRGWRFRWYTIKRGQPQPLHR